MTPLHKESVEGGGERESGAWKRARSVKAGLEVARQLGYGRTTAEGRQGRPTGPRRT